MSEEATEAVVVPKKRGMAQVSDPEVRFRVAQMGGRAAHRMGRAHRFTSEEARAAGRKGKGRSKLHTRAHVQRSVNEL